MATPTRASRDALGLSIGGTSTVSSLSRRPGVPSACSAYIGWKQPAVSAASATMARIRTPMPVLADNIYDPLGHDDHLADSFAVQGLFYRIERQNGSLNFRILGLARHCDLAPLLAIDLNNQRYRVFDQQISFDLGPIRLRNQTLLPQHLPALLGQMRHHRREQLNENDSGLPDGPGEVRRRRALAPQNFGQRIGEFADMGEADVEMQVLDTDRNLVQRTMGGLAKRERVGSERCRPCRGCCFGDLGRFINQPPQPLHETRRTLDAFIAPDHVTVR